MDLQGLAPLFEAPFIWLLICLIVGAIAFAATPGCCECRCVDIHAATGVTSSDYDQPHRRPRHPHDHREERV